MNAPLQRVRFYTLYERLWHWVQAVAVVALAGTGFYLSFPPAEGGEGFRRAVTAHNAFAALLIANAGLALFYNLASGLIRRYVPTASDMFSQGVRHARYYMFGIFRGEPHPFDRTPEKRLLPLQKVTYFAILNFLLPLMVVTGTLRFLAGHYPDWAEALGGRPLLATLHRFGAWMFVSFLALHIYMTTTGRTILANLKAMLTGYGECEEGSQEEKP
jgi:thiosulfate reductase cytochrome b subunit